MTPEELLRLARPNLSLKQYSLGSFDSNITLYRQQVRALNLVYSLATVPASRGGLKLGSKIAIVGGGAFGVTAAAAAASIGYQVRLYEQRQVLLPLQQGCDTRWVNPLYYDWPAVGSNSGFAELPLLSWEAGTAASVAEQIERGFYGEAADSGRLMLRLGAKSFVVEQEDGAFLITCKYGRQIDEWRSDCMVYAVGFGPEQDFGVDASSYWRNDNLAQVDLRSVSSKSEFLVSGVRDGGLTDLARLTVSKFRHERLFHELFDGAAVEVIEQLRDVQSEFAEVPNLESDWLYSRFEDLDTTEPSQGPFADARSYLQKRLRSDTSVTLNGRKPQFRSALNLEHISLSNALLAYLLHKVGGFKYRAGTLTRDADRWILTHRGESKALPAALKVVVRHGTKHAPLLQAGFSSDAMKHFVAAGRVPGTGERLYSAGWWSAARQAPHGQKQRAPQRIEFVSPSVVLLGSTFVSTLADVLSDSLVARAHRRSPLSETKPRFRMTLHRIVNILGQDYFQQVSDYAGLLAPGQRRSGLGRVFAVNAGIGGVAIRTGDQVVYRHNGSTVEDMNRLTNFAELTARPIAPHVASIFAQPFFSADKDSKRALFLVFADSSEADFFDETTLATMSAACSGFVRNIDEALDAGRLRQIETHNSGFEIYGEPSGQDKASLRSVGIHLNDEKTRDQLSFSRLKFTDFEATISRA